MKNMAKMGLWLALLAFALTACATTKIENIVRIDEGKCGDYEE